MGFNYQGVLLSLPGQSLIQVVVKETFSDFQNSDFSGNNVNFSLAMEQWTSFLSSQVCSGCHSRWLIQHIFILLTWSRPATLSIWEIHDTVGIWGIRIVISCHLCPICPKSKLGSQWVLDSKDTLWVSQ